MARSRRGRLRRRRGPFRSGHRARPRAPVAARRRMGRAAEGDLRPTTHVLATVGQRLRERRHAAAADPRQRDGGRAGQIRISSAKAATNDSTAEAALGPRRPSASAALSRTRARVAQPAVSTGSADAASGRSGPASALRPAGPAPDRQRTPAPGRATHGSARRGRWRIPSARHRRPHPTARPARRRCRVARRGRGQRADGSNAARRGPRRTDRKPFMDSPPDLRAGGLLAERVLEGDTIGRPPVWRKTAGTARSRTPRCCEVEQAAHGLPGVDRSRTRPPPRRSADRALPRRESGHRTRHVAS